MTHQPCLALVPVPDIIGIYIEVDEDMNDRILDPGTRIITGEIDQTLEEESVTVDDENRVVEGDSEDVTMRWVMDEDPGVVIVINDEEEEEAIEISRKFVCPVDPIRTMTITVESR